MMTGIFTVRTAKRFAHALGLSLLTLAMLATLAPPAQAADPFYEDMLRKGTDDYNRHEYEAAERSLRIATFGLLEEPQRLTEALVRLGLAQSAAKDEAGFRETFRRIVETESRFHSYSHGIVSDGLKREFENIVAKDVPRQTLVNSPGFAHLVPGAAPAGRSANASMPPASIPSSEQPTIAPAASSGSSQASQVAPTSSESSVAAQLSDIRGLLADGSVESAFARAKDLADVNPSSKEAQLLAAEAAYRLSDWKAAVDYFKRGGDPGDSRPLLLFYWAVSLYETGATDQAAVVLRRSLPRIKHTEYVAAYEAKILGTGNKAGHQAP
jgi:tetratricopeptide (TPR) repeat protein